MKAAFSWKSRLLTGIDNEEQGPIDLWMARRKREKERESEREKERERERRLHELP